MEFYRNFLFQYSLIGIVKPKFFRRNEIRCRIWEIEDLSKNVRKKQDRTSLSGPQTPRRISHPTQNPGSTPDYKYLVYWSLIISID